MATILYTIATVKEYPPEQFEAFQSPEPQDQPVEESRGMSDIFRDLVRMPTRMRRLGLVQFFSWFALFTMWVYTTSALATHQYGLLPTDTHSETFNEAGDHAGFLFGWYNFFALVFAFILTPLARVTSRKFTHMLALFCGGAGLLSIYFIMDPQWLILSMVGIGFAWASILSMPYALLVDSLPPRKMGVYMGIFNFFIVIPQIINALIGGPIINIFFDDYAIYYLVFGGVGIWGRTLYPGGALYPAHPGAAIRRKRDPGNGGPTGQLSISGSPRKAPFPCRWRLAGESSASPEYNYHAVPAGRYHRCHPSERSPLVLRFLAWQFAG
jgi:maltose/moltooligosaccharide transporter